jgi:phosphate transport system substrate-binding protein
MDADGKAIHGKAGAIRPYCAHCRQGDGTYDFVKQNVFGNTDLDIASPYIKRTETFSEIQDVLASDPNAIGFSSISFWAKWSNSSRPLRLSRGSGAYIEPNEFPIKTGEYPLTRNLYLYTAEKKSPLVGQFISLALSTTGQTMLVQSRLVSATGEGEQTASQASSVKQQLLSNPKVPDAYKTLIRESDRTETPYNLRFEAGSGQLDNKSLIDLGRLVQTLKEPRNKDVTVVLMGFSDSRGEPDINLKLSIARAQYVADVLKTQAITQVDIAGFGEEPSLLLNPVESSPEALKDNRRVEVWLKRPAQAAGG